MSRSNVGTKPLGLEYFGKRKGGYLVDRKTSHKMERMQLKEQLREDIDIGLQEYCELEVSHDHCLTMKSLFPKAKSITSYYHHVFGYDVLMVDGEFQGELDKYGEYLAFAYHCGVNYRDFNDLENQYIDFLKENERWGFLH